jgi:ribosomal peptide maturation radical SAM protein 1
VRLTLVRMPWAHLDSPSLAIGVLHACVATACPDVTVSEYHGDLAWADYLVSRSGGDLTMAHCAGVAYSHSTLQYGLGDWVFASALAGKDDDWRLAEMLAYTRPRGIDVSVVRAMRPYASGFADHAAAAILATEPDVVGFSSTYTQNAASLAVAARVKERDLAVQVVFGGANCDGPMGHALLRNYRFIDYVVSGEGETALPELLRAIHDSAGPHGDVSRIPGLCWWRGDEPVANEQSQALVPGVKFPAPEFDGWFAAYERSRAATHAAPALSLEASRGCWWGERHHCTFCGLNGTSMAYRSKPPEQILAEIDQLVSRHRVLDIRMADNILATDYYAQVLPQLAERGWDLRIYFEVKSNLKPGQLAALAAAGVSTIQPGIENLSSRVLKLMDKGVTGAANVATLRDSERHGLRTEWNYLYGFPGETPGDYWPLIEQFPALVHLRPPASVPRLAIERFSPYFNRPELGFGVRRPAEFYHFIYDLPETELSDLVYLFDANAAGIDGAAEEALHTAVERWRAGYPDSALWMADNADGTLEVHDQRTGWPERHHVLAGWRRAGYLALCRGHRADVLHRKLTAAGHDATAGQVTDWLAGLKRDGLVFADDGSYVALALDRKPPSDVVQDPVDLSARDALATSTFIARLRDALATGTAIDWALADPDHEPPGLDTTLLWHLPPPRIRPGEGVLPRTPVTRWRQAFSPGLLYFRNGPGFLSIKDVRDPRRAARMTLTHPAHLEAFRTCLTPTRIDGLSPSARRAVEQLAAERLVLVLGGYATVLPGRMPRAVAMTGP